MLNHSKLPWRRMAKTKTVVASDGEHIARFISQDDAEFVVRVVNSFSPLLDLVRAFAALVTDAGLKTRIYRVIDFAEGKDDGPKMN